MSLFLFVLTISRHRKLGARFSDRVAHKPNQKGDFMEEVVQALEKVPRPCTLVVADWLRKYDDYYARDENKNPVPAFTVNAGVQKFRQGASCIETTAMVYTCAVQDAQYLKTLFSTAQEQGYFKYITCTYRNLLDRKSRSI